MKEMDKNHSCWQSFQLKFNSSAEIVWNQLNLNRKIFVFSQILAEFISLCDISANPNISRFFLPSYPYFFSNCKYGV